MPAVAESWVRIERYCRDHLPAVLVTLRKGASSQAIAEAQEKLGGRLPDDVIASYRIHDGQGYGEKGVLEGPPLFAAPAAPSHYRLLSLEEMLKQSDSLSTKARGRYFPTGYMDGDVLYVGPGGSLVSTSHDEEGAKAIAPSLEAWLARFADDLEAGFYRQNKRLLSYSCAAPIFPRGDVPPPESLLAPFAERYPDVPERVDEKNPITRYISDLEEALRAGDRARKINVSDLPSLSPEIGRLRQLTDLQLNRLRSEVLPSEIGHLTNLESLAINKSALRYLPRSLGRLGQKKAFSLFIEGSDIEAFPEQIFEIRRLEQLQLSRSRLTAVPPGFSRLQELQTLDLSGNGLTTLPEEIREISTLEEVDLSRNPIRDIEALRARFAPLEIVY